MAPHPNARQPRAAEETQERRRRNDGTLDRMSELTLAVPQAVREANPDKNFRWINDTGNRIHSKTVLDDWDVVEGVDPKTVGTDREGKPLKAFLCAKRKDFYAEDEAKKMAALREQERGMIQGERDGTTKQELPDAVAYTPSGNTIGAPAGRKTVNRLSA